MNKQYVDKEFLKGKTVLITGAAGSIGRELCKKMSNFDVKSIRALDNNETGLFDLEEDLEDNRVRIFVGDIRDMDRIHKAMNGVEIVFHAAALKHVPICEYNTFEAVKTNVVGTQNLIEEAIEFNVEKFIFVSTDKAVLPISVMGITKLLGEKLTIAANLHKGNTRTIFSCIRFGNVLGSRGSVIPLFINQIKKNKRISLTDPRMTRFVMDIPQAIDLVLKATYLAQYGETFIFKMPAIKIIDLAKEIISICAEDNNFNVDEVKIEFIGKRLGEKIHESLLNDDEKDNVVETDDMFILYPQFHQINNVKRKGMKVNSSYLSNRVAPMKRNEIRELLNRIFKR